MLDAFKLDGKTALVTGCNRGIGRGYANALAEAGADIIGVSEHLADDGDVADEIRALGRNFHGYSCDLSQRKLLFDFIERAKANHPQIDILVNNAGTIRRKPAAEFPDDYWDHVIKVNLDAQFFLAREFGREMLGRGWGRIVFTASLLSFQGGITVPSYAASKGGIPQLAMALSNEWASKGVTVNCIAPGYIRTDVTKALQEDPVRNPAILARIPAGRWGDPADLKGAVTFLCSPAAAYVSGVTIPVDGGWMGR
ncbi:MAG: SDR family NAD(P)-dependent oxidoreductase [Bryobacterales bacterium]|nr:SDR family NAD(P)-dependent oxidoreductase [Bryobacterales bacterium]